MNARNIRADAADVSNRLCESMRMLREPLRAAELMIDIAGSVAYAHERGLVHRDLKPANVLLDSEGRPHIADFGLAVHETGQRLLQGEIAGTPPYMAPEQVRGERTIDPRADVWSLGVMLYELLSGQRPFEHESPVAVLAAVLLEEPPPLVELVPNVSLEFAALAHRCLDKRPEARPANGDALADAMGRQVPFEQLCAGIDRQRRS